MKLTSCLTLISSVLFFTSASLAAGGAQPGPALKQGDIELGGGIALVSTEDYDDNVNVRARAGVLFTTELSFGLDISTTLFGNDSVTGVFADAQYNFFMDPRIVPYAGGKIGFAELNDDDDKDYSSAALGIMGGIKYFYLPDLYFYGEFDDTYYFVDGGHSSVALTFGIVKVF